MRRIYAIMLGAFIVAGCLPYDINEILLAREDISITQKGTLIMNYDPLKCQMSHDKATNTYIIYDDMIANWFIVSCSTRPDTEGQEITADVTWTTDKNTKTERGLVFTVKKIDSQGQIWMWNKSKSIGIVIKNL